MCVYSTHTMEYYSALKKKEVLPLVTTWINPEDIILRNKPDTERQSPIRSHLYVKLKKKKQSNLEYQRKEWWFSRGWSVGKGEIPIKGYKLSPIDEYFLETSCTAW